MRHSKLLCSIPECGRPVRGSSGMCARCRAWWLYHRRQSATEFSGYLNRLKLAGSRVGLFRG